MGAEMDHSVAFIKDKKPSSVVHPLMRGPRMATVTYLPQKSEESAGTTAPLPLIRMG
jgi:hypothetical protein